MLFWYRCAQTDEFVTHIDVLLDGFDGSGVCASLVAPGATIDLLVAILSARFHLLAVGGPDGAPRFCKLFHAEMPRRFHQETNYPSLPCSTAVVPCTADIRPAVFGEPEEFVFHELVPFPYVFPLYSTRPVVELVIPISWFGGRRGFNTHDAKREQLLYFLSCRGKRNRKVE